MSTEWYYAIEGTSHGPVSQAEFENLVSVGAIRSDTLVWQEGMEDWLPYRRAGGTDNAEPMQPHAPISNTQNPARSDANTFLGALKDGFARYVDFKSRSTRSQFWWWTLWSLIIDVVTGFIDGDLWTGNFGPVNLLVSVAIFLPSLAVGIRRLHDTGRSGWWYLLIFLPIIGWIILLVFFCTKTQEQANQWGLPPNR